MTVAKLVDVSRTVETTAASAQKVDHSASGFNPPKKVFFFFFFVGCSGAFVWFRVEWFSHECRWCRVGSECWF